MGWGITLAAVWASVMGLAAEGGSNPLQEFPLCESLPDPFHMEDGRRVESLADWRARREEMLDLLLRLEYGRVPPSPGNVAAEPEITTAPMHEGKTERREIVLRMGPDRQLAVHLQLSLPSERKAPVSAVVRIGMGCPIIEEMNDRGYALASFEHRDLDPEGEGEEIIGPAQAAYPDYDWGSVAVWAWGASRVLDYLITVPEIRSDRIVVTGHSRTGKAALLAGALDERFAVVVPNGSGCGGASCYRMASPDSETLALITEPARFRGWFQKDFGRFGGNEARLPFDQHFLRALVAPRGMLTTEAREDFWCNPLGAQAAYQAAQPVFDFLRAGARNALHFREGQHDQLPEDFRLLMDFADRCFGLAPAEEPRWALPFPDYKPELDWDIPAVSE